MKGLIFTYLMAYGGSVIALFNPFVGLLIYISFAIIQPNSLWFWSVPQGNYSRFIALAMLVGWAVKGFGNWQFGKAKIIVYMLVGYGLSMVISALTSANPEVSWESVEAFGKILLPFLVGMTLIDSEAKLEQLAWVLMFSIGYLAFEMNLAYLSGFNRLYWNGFAGMDNNSVAIEMVAGIGLAFFLGFGAKTWIGRAIAFFSAILLVHAVLFSFSRGGMLALVITVLVCFYLIPKKPMHYIVLIFFVGIGITLAGKEVTARFSTVFSESDGRDSSAQSRLDLWKDCWDVMLHHPVLGVGPDHWPLIAHEYGWKEGKEAHSLWMQTGAELGFPGLLLLVLFYGISIKHLLPLARSKLEECDVWHQSVARMVIASVIGFCISAQFVSLERLEFPFYVVLLGAGMLKYISLYSPVEQGDGVFAQSVNKNVLS